MEEQDIGQCFNCAELSTRLAQSEKAREEKDFDYQQLAEACKREAIVADNNRLRAEAAESALAALQEENVRYRDALESLTGLNFHDYETMGIGPIEVCVLRSDFAKTTFKKYINTIRQALYSTPETGKIQAVIKAAIVWAKSDTPIRDCSDRDLRHAIDDLNRDE